MQAVMPAGSKRSPTQVGPVSAWVGGVLLGAMPGVVLCQEQAQSTAKASTIDQIELLLLEQQTLQLRQTQQLQGLRQQLDEQNRLNELQDWQWAGGLSALLILALVGVWFAAQWPAWQRARSSKQALRNAQRVEAATQDLLRQGKPGADASRISAGGGIDHSGPGLIEQVLRWRKLKQAVKQSEAKAGWKASLEEPDSRLLADDAVREYELRKTVGLQEELAAAEKRESKIEEVNVETAWQAMQEIPLEVPLEAPLVDSTSDVTVKVQRVRKTLQQRRQERVLGEIAGNASYPSSEDDVDSARLDFELPSDLPEVKPQKNQVGKHRTQNSSAPPSGEILLGLRDAQLPQPREPELSVTVDADLETSLSALVPPSAAALVSSPAPLQDSSSSYSPGLWSSFSPSVRGMTHTETLLALAQEFAKLGQFDEAAMLCEEVQNTGTVAEQFRARQYLGSLPGR